ncbi:N-acetylmuramoyl-L-alanine amidase [Hyphobacterium sp. HN65]|uniref:N-acetylmuramoyl-L-alanine amidase n=1 Tax=Hyphobacterium lacteum TaxID=3116575 RepID=A0ABU7LQZ7_9PROT|nr:N-acetylmuramoyl-L-alanine amidase [Hyphobacterium sp. HN65]MEE2526331.1 N-acetylmuramoyl-L-alanine amidase [Hyphobacterium sp. HN65]
MTVIHAPSPNFNERAKPVSLIVLHYTGMESGEAALQRMCDSEAKVSAHYMIEEDGRIFQLVEESKRAWHAGVSEWAGETDINAVSIGIEIVNGGHDFGLPDYPQAQIDVIISLTKQLMVRHNIPAHRVVGHSDIAPGRKQDPGEKFPWNQLSEAGCAIFPKVAVEPGDIRVGLSQIGYGFSAGEPAVIEAFQRRFRPAKVDGILDDETASLISAVAALTPKS